MMAKCFLGHYIQNSQKGGVIAGASTIFTLSEHQLCPLIDSSGPEGSRGRGPQEQEVLVGDAVG